MKIALCLLTLNEIAGCKHDVPSLPRDIFSEIYAIDGGSTDGTIDYLTSEKIPVYQQRHKGLNDAYLLAMEKCHADALIFFHPKGSILAAETVKMSRYLADGYDLVVGSRNAVNAENEEDKRILRPRKWFVMGLSFITAFFFLKQGTYMTDVLHGFRGINVASFKELSCNKQGATIDLEMIMYAYTKNLKCIEFSVRETRRLVGETHFRAIPTGWALLGCLIKRIFR
jgi:glycosyltransferase involved in cell wall biosynthesis